MHKVTTQYSHQHKIFKFISFVLSRHIPTPWHGRTSTL